MDGIARFDVVSFLHNRNEKKFFKVQCKETKRYYTMEVIPNNNIDGALDENYTTCDGSCIKSINSDLDLPFSMALKVFFKTTQKCCYILDYAGETNFASLARGCDGFSENIVLFVAAELAIALTSLHDRGLSYGELSLDTVMVDNEGHVILWREFVEKQYWHVSECVCSLTNTTCDNPDHKNQCEDNGLPKVKSDAIKSDWKALGVVLHTLLVGELSGKKTSHEEIWFPEFLTATTKDLIQELLKGTVVTFDEVKRNRCFVNVDWNKVKSKSIPSPLKTVINRSLDSTMSHYNRKYTSSQNISSTSAFNRAGRRTYSGKPTFSRSSSSSDLFSSSWDANSRPGSPERRLTTLCHSSSFPIQTNSQNGSKTEQMGITGNNGDRLTTSWTYGAKAILADIDYLRPSYLSAPSSPRKSMSTSVSLYSSTSNLKDDINLKNSNPSTHTDITSSVSGSVGRATPDYSFQGAALNRSRSYVNLKNATCDFRDEVSARPGPGNQKANSEGGQVRKRSSAWAPIPTFEEFQAMRLSAKRECESRDVNNNKDDDSNNNSSSNNNNDHVTDCTTIPESLHGPTIEKKEPLTSCNPVIQELLVKYGLNKPTNLTRRPVQDPNTSSTTAAPDQTDATSRKQRLLGMMDAVLVSKDKERTSRTTKSMSEVRNLKSLVDRRATSSPRITLYEEAHVREVRECLNNDVERDLKSGGNRPAKSKTNSKKQEQTTAKESFAEVPKHLTRKAASISYRDGLQRPRSCGGGSLQRPRSYGGETEDKIFKHQTKELKDDIKYPADSGHNDEEELTKGFNSVRQPREERTQAEEQPEISINVSNSETSKQCATVGSIIPQESTKILRKSSETNRKDSPQKRSSSDVGKKERKLRKSKSRTLSEGSEHSNKDDSSNIENIKQPHGVRRTSSKRNSRKSICSTKSDSSLNTEGEFPRKERSCSRGSSFLSVTSDGDFPTDSSLSLVSRGNSFASNVSTDSGSLHVDFEDSDDNVFNCKLGVVQEKTETEIKRNDSGLGDEIGVAPRLKKRWEDIVDGSSRQWSVVASSARYWREVTMKKKENRLQAEKCNEARKISRGRKISGERSPNAVDCPDCGRPFVVDKDKPSVFSEGPKRSVICYKCQSHRVERKEAIIELVQTEINCGNDFQILKEEFFSPMQSGGIVSPENLSNIFLNSQELLDVSLKFCKKIESSMQECIGKNDEEFCHMQVGKIFVDNVEFFQAYELYCFKQPDAFTLLESLQKKNEVLKVFLNITCRENTKCRKMDINSFLLAPVQRLMKYPLLLNRIRKTTPRWHGDREDLKLAQRKIEDQITKINSQTKSSDIKTRKIQSNLGSSDAVDSSRLEKLACDVLNWTMDEIQLLMHGVLKVTCCEFGVTQSWTKRAVKRCIETHLLFCIRGQNEPIQVDSDEDDSLHFPHISEVSDASLLLLKRKNNGKYTLFRDEIRLRDCVVYEETENDSFSLIHMGQETFVFTTRTSKETRRWLKHLRLQTKDQGQWRLRRNALANIMLKAS